jgi:hypothetical protein
MTRGSFDVRVVAAGDHSADAELEAFFAACPTALAQQTPAWREVIAGTDRDEPFVLTCWHDGRLVGVLPAFRFVGRLGAVLNSSTQAGKLGGVASLPGFEPAPIYEALLGAFAELGASTGCAVATVISNPFWPDAELYERYLRPDYALENVCQVLDLSQALDASGELTAASDHLARNLRKAQSGALAIDERQTRDNVEEWYAVHQRRHTEIGAAPIPKALFTGALEHMVPRDQARFFFVRATDSQTIVGGGFYLYHGAVIDALMPSVATAALEHRPSYLLALHSMRWARARGLRYYNWEPSPPDSGVYRFKRQWGSRDVAYGYFTRVTGDIEPFLRSSVDQVLAEYRWHYVLPFNQVGADRAAGAARTSRRAAWTAGEGMRR